MALVVGTLLAIAVGLLGAGSGLDRDRAYYPVVTIVTASYYALFAVMAGSIPVLVLESLAVGVFLAAAIGGFKSSLWVVVAALAAHGLFDLGHDSIIANPGVPGWWPEFCLTFDVALALYVGLRLKRGHLQAVA